MSSPLCGIETIKPSYRIIHDSLQLPTVLCFLIAEYLNEYQTVDGQVKKDITNKFIGDPSFDCEYTGSGCLLFYDLSTHDRGTEEYEDYEICSAIFRSKNEFIWYEISSDGSYFHCVSWEPQIGLYNSNCSFSKEMLTTIKKFQYRLPPTEESKEPEQILA